MSKATKQHFELIARVLREQRDSYTPQQPAIRKAIAATALRFAEELAYTNPNFDRGRFLKACGLEG